MPQASPSIINVSEITVHPLPAPYAPTGEALKDYSPTIASLCRGHLGINLVVLTPGKRAFPFHNHRANGEAFFVLAGAGHLRLGAERYAIRAGDLISCPAGGKETAHQLINTGDDELRYLAIGTNSLPDVIEYPDSGLIKLMGPNDQGSHLDMLVREDAGASYWHLEPR